METVLPVSHVAHTHSEEAAEAKWPLCNAAGFQRTRRCCATQHPPSYETLSEELRTFTWGSTETHGGYDTLREGRKMAPPHLNSRSALHGAPHRSRCALSAGFLARFALFSVTVSLLPLRARS